jgi:hypothetical protein
MTVLRILLSSSDSDGASVVSEVSERGTRYQRRILRPNSGFSKVRDAIRNAQGEVVGFAGAASRRGADSSELKGLFSPMRDRRTDHDDYVPFARGGLRFTHGPLVAVV